MNRYQLTITVEEDLLLASVPAGGNEAVSLPYVPGTVLRGALARPHAPGPSMVPDDAFRKAFLSAKILFLDALPYKTEWGVAQWLPSCAMSCKHCGGFRTGPELRHGMFSRFETIPDGEVCPLCNAPLERQSGFYFRMGARFARADIPLHFEAHNELDDNTRKTVEGALYTEFRVPRGTVFMSELRFLEEPDTLDPGRLLPRPGESTQVRLGRSKATAALRCDDHPGADPLEELQEVGEEGICYLMLSSIALVEDSWGRAFRRFDQDTLAAMLLTDTGKLGLQLFDAGEQYTRYCWVSGFNAAQGLPKCRELGLAPGSCGAFLVTDINLARASLTALLTGGGGYRTNEGFGQVLLNPPFLKGWADEERKHGR